MAALLGVWKPAENVNFISHFPALVQPSAQVSNAYVLAGVNVNLKGATSPDLAILVDI